MDPWATTRAFALVRAHVPFVRSQTWVWRAAGPTGHAGSALRLRLRCDAHGPGFRSGEGIQ